MLVNPLLNTHKVFKISALSLAMALTACGGGSDGNTVDVVKPVPSGGTTTGNGGAVNNKTSYEAFISASKGTLNSGSDELTLTVRVTDENGGIKSGVPVYVSIVDSAKYGLSLGSASTLTTNEEGLATTKLIQNNIGPNAQLDYSAEIVVTIDDGISDKVTKSLTLDVTGAEVDKVTSSSNILRPNEKLTIKGTLLDGNEDVIRNVDLKLINNGLEVKEGKTNSEGEFEFDINENELTADSMGVLKFDLIATADNEVSKIFPNIVNVTTSTSEALQLEYSDIALNEFGTVIVNVPLANNGEEVTVTTNKGLFDNGKLVQTQKVVNNQAVFRIKSQVPGIATLRTTYNNQTQSDNLTFVSVLPTKITIQPISSEVGIGGSTEIISKVLDNNDAPVKNATVQFSLIQDGSSGTLSNSIVQTDNSGTAKIIYNAGDNPTASNGVKIRSRVEAITLPNGTISNISPALEDTASLTVQTTATSIAFGLADKLTSGQNQVYYYYNGSVFVNNNSGQPAANQQVSIALRPKSYAKGQFYVVDSPIEGVDSYWALSNYYQCDNEDLNFNGFLDPGEDFNESGQLEPGYVATVLNEDGNEITMNNGVYQFTTDEMGKVNFRVRYLKSYGQWFTMTMKATTKVDGSEATQERPINFSVLEDDVDIEKRRRPNLESPFGSVGDCSVSPL